CTFATAGPAWTVIQRRSSAGDAAASPGQSFNCSWEEYRAGFGALSGDFWFGNEFIHRMVYRDDYELRVELEDREGIRAWAGYGLFRLDSESYGYQLEIGQLDGGSTARDALAYHNRMSFRAYERNGDDGCDGWWLDRCQEAESNLNGRSMMWSYWQQEHFGPLRASRMLIRPRGANP
ncbi:hypothetical protein KR222_000570, partial [Zaprionus bogoriensis]